MSRSLRLGVPFLLLLLLLSMSIGTNVAAQGTKEARGTVTAVTDSSLSVKAGTQELKFTVDPKTTVTAEGAGTQERTAKATGAAGIKLTGVIKTGQAVIVTYTESGGALRASEVRAVSTAGPGGGGVAAPAAAGAAASAATASKDANGTVKSVTASSLVVTSSGKDMTFAITPETLVQGRGVGTAAAAAGGKIAITSVVGAGDTVSVRYQESGTTMRATEVRVTTKAAK